MKHKVSELEGVLLDCAVAECRLRAGDFYRWRLVSAEASAIGREYCSVDAYNVDGAQYEPSTDWSDGGPIIERERILLDSNPDSDPEKPWLGSVGGEYAYGPTALIAAMRAYVASKLGDEVELP